MCQWTDEEWKQFEAEMDTVTTFLRFQDLLDATREQESHPLWYMSSCSCMSCQKEGIENEKVV
ncbi:MAG: hypothetical protein GY928_25945 [Colwellia sp.]|nr:hypothetical protein [Colwellia sp.]